MSRLEEIIKGQTPKLQEYVSKRRNANCFKCNNKIEVLDLAISETYVLSKGKKLQRIHHKKCYTNYSTSNNQQTRNTIPFVEGERVGNG